VNSLGTHLERTFEEWQGTLFAHGQLALTCGECHMAGRTGPAATTAGAPSRRLHAHDFPAVDVALTAGFPGFGTQEGAVQAELDQTLQAALCVKGAPGAVTIQVVLDNVGAGHGWPSGAAQDRRAFVEVIAQAGGQALYQSGVVADGADVTKLQDPDLWLLRDCIFDAQGDEVHMFWQAASHDPDMLPGPVTVVQTDPMYLITHAVRDFPRASTLTTMPDQVTMRVRLTPIGLDVLGDLVQSGDLEPAAFAPMPTYTLGGTDLTWTAATATIKYLDSGLPVTCVSKGLSFGANAALPAPQHTKCQP
jgi:hypothetical protein